MDAELLSESVEYELLTQAIYQAIIRQEGQDVAVQQNVKVTGKSGVDHQIDVLWRHKIAGVEQLVLIECKNYKSALTLEKVRNFFGVMYDIGNCCGVMVTRTGYQSGVEKYANFYKIGLKLLRSPTKEDWEGRIKDIHIDIHYKVPVGTADRPISVNANVAVSDPEQGARLKALQDQGRMSIPSGMDMVFWSADRIQNTKKLGDWLPEQLNVLEKDAGGPFTETIPLDDKYFLLNAGDQDEEFVKVSSLEVKYYVETIEKKEIVILGDTFVDAILKDFSSGKVEYVKHKTGTTE